MVSFNCIGEDYIESRFSESICEVTFDQVKLVRRFSDI